VGLGEPRFARLFFKLSLSVIPRRREISWRPDGVVVADFFPVAGIDISLCRRSRDGRLCLGVAIWFWFACVRLLENPVKWFFAGGGAGRAGGAFQNAVFHGGRTGKFFSDAQGARFQAA